MRAIWILGVWAALMSSAQAEQVRVESLEYRVAHADRVIIGTVRDLKASPQHDGWRLAEVTVEETLRGPASKAASVLIRGMGGVWHKVAQLLIFLVDPGRFGRLSPPPTAPGTLMADLGWSSLKDQGHGAVLMTGPPIEMVARDGRMLKTRADVLQAVRAAAKIATPAPAKGVFLGLGLDEEAHQALYAGSGVDLKVPLDAQLIAQARGWIVAPDPNRRAEAVRVFAAVEGPEGEARLRSLLDDPATGTRTTAAGKRTQVWYIREMAVDALKARGVVVKPVVIEAPLPPSP